MTLEVNPSTLERERLPAFREAGVDRVSLGIQSFDDTTLRRLGRAHRAREGRRTLAACRAAGFARLSLDLIFAAPGQDLAAFDARARGRDRRGARARLGLRAHARAGHAVRARGGARAARDRRTRRPPRACSSGSRSASAPRAIGATRSRAMRGPGCEAVHNQRYWERRPVLGLGMGAVSTDPPAAGSPARRAPHEPARRSTRYLEVVAGARDAEVEVLDAARRARRGDVPRAAHRARVSTRGLRARVRRAAARVLRRRDRGAARAGSARRGRHRATCGSHPAGACCPTRSSRTSSDSCMSAALTWLRAEIRIR